MRFLAILLSVSVWHRLSLLAAALLVDGLPSARAQLPARATANLTLPNEVPAGPQVLRNALGSLVFTAPLAIASAPGVSSTLFVVEKGGTIQTVNLHTLSKQTFLNVRDIPGVGDKFNSEGEAGLLGLAFHPDYATNRTFYIYYTVRTGYYEGQRRISRVRASGSSLTLADPTSHEPLIGQSGLGGIHYGGDLHFGPDGYLYISVGDGGLGDDARWVDRDFAAGILRLDVDRKNVGQTGGSLEPNPHPAIALDAQGKARYAVPPDNPLLAGAAGTLGPIGAGAYPSGAPLQAEKLRTELFAYGLRNPWRFSFDPPTGRLFVGDVGEGTREEVDLVTKGANLGWPYREGTFERSWTSPPANPGSPRLDPIHDYPRSDGYSITGGRVYRGSAFPEFSGAYIFADYSGRIYALRESPSGWTRELLVRGETGIAGIGRHPATGELLFASLGTGEIKGFHRQSPAISLPTTLSATGLFSDIASLAPAAGVVPYDINHPAWNDHARVRRWFAQRDSSARFSATRIGDDWSVPNRMVWVQHLTLETERGNPASARRIETRVLVRNHPEVYGVSYRWRADQSDADLVPHEGAEFDIPTTVDGVAQTQRWRIPGWNDCLSCHSPGSAPARAFDIAQLNRTVTHGAVTENQLRQLHSAGYVSTSQAPTDADYANARALPTPDDQTQSLEHRLRTYLAVNCASCHAPATAPMGASAFSLASALTTEATRIRHAIPKNLGGDPEARLLAPAAPEHSMLLRRILGDGVPRMPPIGPSQTDPHAEALLRAYIAQLPDQPLYDDWHRSHFADGVPAREKITDPDGDASDNRLEYLAHSSPVSTNPDPTSFRVETVTGGRLVRFLQPARRIATIEYPNSYGSWIAAPSPHFGYPTENTERELLVPSSVTTGPLRLRLEER